MEKLLLLTVLLSTCFAEPIDLLGKVFVFSKQSKVDGVSLLTNHTEFNSVTVCLRFLTDIKSSSYGLFSLSTASHNNDFLLYKPDSEDVIRIHAHDVASNFLSLSFPANTWHSMCATWRSDNGLAQLWVDGVPTIKRFVKSGQPIRGKPSTILGQDQDSYGGGFDANQSFIGMMSKVHMWNYVIPDSEIKRYMKDRCFTPGNVFNWRSLDYVISGQVYVEDDPHSV